jgi:4-amino-4-deoxy-L-arabinose transferase-like glycosyltransferase
MNATPSGTIDDDALGQLARERRLPLIPLLTQADAMVPLVIVLAFLPALYAIHHRTLTEAGAWEGLAGLRCMDARNLAEFVDTAALDPANPYRFQPPLMTWLTEIGMRLGGAGTVAGSLAAAYLCTAGLIVAGYVLARRLGGELLGLITAGLLAFNPVVLEGAQEPVPQSAACLFAVLAVAGAVAHWQKSPVVTSYQLLLGGLSLGACLLAGGSVSLAVLLILLLYVVWWKADAWLRRRLRLSRERSPFSRRPAIRSLVVLAATAFAVGGWHVLLMSNRYGAEFWKSWWTIPPAALAASQLAGRAWLLDTAWEFNRLALPLLGMSLVGIVTIVRDLIRAEDDPARQHRGLLVVWIAVALPAWLISRGFLDGDAPSVRTWEVLLAIPLVITAALALIEISRRRIGFFISLAFGVLALAGTALFVDQWLTGAATGDEIPIFPGLHLSPRGAAILVVIAAAGFALARFAFGQDAPRRIVLTAILAVIIAANCVWGALAVRRTSAGDRELEGLRSGLARMNSVNRVARSTFVDLTPPTAVESVELPAQLVFLVASQWPGAAIGRTESWEEAASESNPRAIRDEETATVFIAWSPRGRVRGVAPPADLKLAAPPFTYHGLEVNAYLREPALRAAIGESVDDAIPNE